MCLEGSKDIRGGMGSSGRMHCPLVARPPPLHVPSILQVLEGPSVQGRCLCGSWWKHLVQGTPRPSHRKTEKASLRPPKNTIPPWPRTHDRGTRDKGMAEVKPCCGVV